MHMSESLINLVQRGVVSDVFVNVDLAGEVVFNDAWKFRSPFDSAERGSSPYATSYQLEPNWPQVSELGRTRTMFRTHGLVEISWPAG